MKFSILGYSFIGLALLALCNMKVDLLNILFCDVAIAHLCFLSSL